MHLGIMTFLRRSRKTYPPLSATPIPPAPLSAPPGTVEQATRVDERPPARPAEAIPFQPKTSVLVTAPHSRMEHAVPVEAAPRAFHSERYAYSLTLPAGWMVEASRSIAGSPPIERFRSPDGLTVGVWNEPCPLRLLPRPEGSSTLMPLAGKRTVRFATYDPNHAAASRFLEGVWLADGRRWSAYIQLPPGSEGEPDLTAVRRLFASFSMEHAESTAG